MWYRPAALFVLTFFSFALHARSFSNSFLSFELPDNWVCNQEGVAWVCSTKGPNQQNDAIIVMAAKIAAPQDTLVNFKEYLQKPRTITSRAGTAMPSSVMYAQERVLAGAKWVQAQHLSSEVLDFYTLYIATVKDSLAILVTFSAEKSKYAFYNPIFDQAMKSLKLVANNQLVFPKNTGSSGIAIFGITGDTVNPEYMPPPPPAKRHFPFALLLLAGAALAGAAYYFYKPKKPK